ncbi:MAG: hypothetical protein ACOCXP_02275 [Candidatus Dojkabacteria bacterium]
MSHELQILSKLDRLLAELSTKEQQRCLNWLRDKYSIDTDTHVDYPKNMTQEELVLEVIERLTANTGKNEFKAREINNALKERGVKVSNISTILSRLASTNPAPIVVSRSRNNSKNSQKSYRLTQSA